MLRKLIAIVVLLLGACWQTAAADEPLPPASRWIAKDAVLALEVVRPKPLLDLVLSDKTAKAVTSFPAYSKAAAEPKFQQFLGMVKYIEAVLATDWKTATRKLAGGGVALAVYPQGGVLLVLDGEDPQLLQRLHETFLGFARSEAEKQKQPGRVASEDYRGVTVWTFAPGEAHAIVGNRLLLANRMETLKAALDLRAAIDGSALVSLPTYQAARKSADADALATVFVSLAALKENPKLQQALDPNTNPLAALLLADVLEALRSSDVLTMALRIDGDTLALRAMADSKPAAATGAAAFAEPQQPDQGAMPNLAVPRRIAAVSLYRDLHGFYAAKDKLFPERTSGLIFFENMMGIFFTGRDLTEEVLVETQPEVRLIVASQDYDAAVGTPRVQIPAFAAVFRLRHPADAAQMTEEAWQKAVGLVSFTRGQKAEPGLILDRDSHDGVRYSVAYFAPPKEIDKNDLDMRFNFRPAIARIGEYLVLSSTDGLAKDLIDALKRETAGPSKAAAGRHSLVEADGVQLSAVLSSNRGNMVRNNMLEKGNTEEEAQSEIDLLTSIIRLLGQAKLNVDGRQGQIEAGLQLKLNLP
jgi:hypothetical protein